MRAVDQRRKKVEKRGWGGRCEGEDLELASPGFTPSLSTTSVSLEVLLFLSVRHILGMPSKIPSHEAAFLLQLRLSSPAYSARERAIFKQLPPSVVVPSSRETMVL